MVMTTVTVPLTLDHRVKLVEDREAEELAERQRAVREAMGDKWLCAEPQSKSSEQRRG